MLIHLISTKLRLTLVLRRYLYQNLL